MGPWRSVILPVGLAAFQRPALGDPLLQPAVEDRDVAGTEVAQHEPAACRRAQGRVVIDDDAVAAADSDLFHCPSELSGTRQHVGCRIGGVADRIDVEEDRAGNMRLQIVFAAASVRRRHVQAAVDHGQVRFVEMFREPLGRDE